MKNQNDLIFSLGALFVLIVAFCVCFFTQPHPTPPSAPAKVNLAEPQIPTDVQPVMANALPSGSSNSGSASGGFGAAGGPPVGGNRPTAAGVSGAGSGPGSGAIGEKQKMLQGGMKGTGQ